MLGTHAGTQPCNSLLLQRILVYLLFIELVENYMTDFNVWNLNNSHGNFFLKIKERKKIQSSGVVFTCRPSEQFEEAKELFRRKIQKYIQ